MGTLGHLSATEEEFRKGVFPRQNRTQMKCSLAKRRKKEPEGNWENISPSGFIRE